MINRLQKKYALSDQGAKDLLSNCLLCTGKYQLDASSCFTCNSIKCDASGGSWNGR